VARLIDRFNPMVRGDGLGAPVGRLIGFRPTSIEPRKAVFGGILCDVADAGMGTAYASRLDEGESFTTLELKINFLRPFSSGRLVATASTVKAGRTISLVECDVTDAEGALAARAMSTCMTLRGESSEGR